MSNGFTADGFSLGINTNETAPILEPQTLFQTEAPTVEIQPDPTPSVETVKVESNKKINQTTSTFKPIPNDFDYKKNITQYLFGKPFSSEVANKALVLINQLLKKKDAPDEERKTLISLGEAINEAYTNQPAEDFSTFFEDNDTVQSVIAPKNNSVRIKRITPRLASSSNNISGKDALRFVYANGLGVKPCKIPLWDSGLSINLDSIGEDEFLNLAVSLTVNAVELGKSTRGAVFTGDDIHIVWPIIDFLITKITDTTLDEMDVSGNPISALSNLILITDIESMLAGALAVLYPQGYPVYHPCINSLKNNNSCNYTLISKRDEKTNDFLPDTLLDFTTIMHVKDDYVSMEDLQVLTAEAGTVKVSDLSSYKLRRLDRYKRKYNTDHVVVIDNENIKVSIHFEVPTISKYRQESFNWIATVKRKTDDVLTLDTELDPDQASERRLDALLYESKILRLSKHLPWISFISLTDKENDVTNTLDESSEIAINLSAFSNDDVVIEKIEKALSDFKATYRTSMPGFQNFPCPVCASGQVKEGSEMPSVIPLNLVSYFFTTLSWKLASLGPIR